MAVPAYAQTELMDYVRTRAADADGATDVAVVGYAAALTRNPDDAVIAMRAYRQGLAIGDYALVARAEAVLAKNPDAPIDAPIIAVALAIQSGNKAGCEAALARMEKGPLEFMIPVLRAWMAFERGEDPFPFLDLRGGGTGIARRFALEHRALLLIASGRTAEGLDGVRRMLASADNDDLRVTAAMLLGQMGKRSEALSLLTGDKPEYALLRKALKKGKKPGAGFGAARMFVSVAADLATESAEEISIILTRAALLLDPGDDRARIYLADALSKSRMNPLALAELAKIGSKSPWYRAAFSGKVAVLRRAGRLSDAVAQAKIQSDARGATATDARIYGELLSETGQYPAAATAFAAAQSRAGGAGDWSLYYRRGVALDKAGRWAEALPQLKRAIELGPEEAQPLAYLGNAMIDRGESPDDALALLERASRLKRGDPAITDSLGWAYYRRGDLGKALPLLERAAKADPGDSKINEHLGDAYWRSGRRFEARYAWIAAKIYADDDAKKRLDGKIANGL